jgi:hypothetical protein
MRVSGISRNRNTSLRSTSVTQRPPAEAVIIVGESGTYCDRLDCTSPFMLQAIDDR